MIINVVYEKLPFEIFRLIVDYLGILPKCSSIFSFQIRTFMKKHYCQKCGEYKYIEKKRKNYHLSCHLEKWKNLDYNNWLLAYVGYTNIFRKNIQYRAINGTELACPVMIKTKKRHLGYYKWKNEKIRFHKPQIHIFEFDFCVLPIIFLENNCINEYYIKYWMDHYMLNYTKDYLIKKFKKSSVKDLLFCIYILNIEAIKFIHSTIVEHITMMDDLSFDIFKMLIKKKGGIHHIMYYHPNWFKKIIYKYPEMIDEVDESLLKYFFKKNTRWFLNCMKIQPNLNKYVTLYKEE